MIVLTAKGREIIDTYIQELRAKRKEILDAGKDTADDTTLPNVYDIICDIEQFMDADGDYYNNWGVTDNYDSDYPLQLSINKDFTAF